MRPSRTTGPSSRRLSRPPARSKRRPNWSCSAEPLQFVDEAADDTEAFVPEGRIGGVQAERRQELVMGLGAARGQHLQIAVGEGRVALLIDRIERVHQTIAERIGVDIKRRMDEMRDVSPEMAISRIEA